MKVTSSKHQKPLRNIALVCMIALELSVAWLIQFAPNFICAAIDKPCARSTYIPLNPYVNVTVSFDASTSTSDGGYIVSYEWNFGDGANGTGMFTTKIYTEPGNYTVTLTVTDSEGEKDTASKMVNVIPEPIGAYIDMYNQRGGQGLYEPDGTFNLGETVILTSFLLYENEPVQNKPVGFAVLDPTGEVVLDRSNCTDTYGLASINFTIPDICSPNIFGTWIAVATASVSEQVVSDTLTFKVKGPYIDVYTQKEPYGGRGPNQPSDSFEPQEEVILCAYVSYTCEPQQNKPVGFEVIDPTGNVIVDRTAFSNPEGIANITFRIPWPCENPEKTVFGTWTVLAKVSILELTAEDTLTFQVGWIVEITELGTANATGAAKNSFAKCEHICFNLTARNIAFTSKTATFTVVVYDAEKVPIGHVTLYNWMIPPGTSMLFMISVHVPKWAYTGIAAVYANAYTDMPTLCGVPYCPEVSTPFTITS